MNLTDRAPLTYTRRVVAGIATYFGPVVVGMAPGTLKGQRFGNVVVSAGAGVVAPVLIRRASAAVFPYRLLDGLELDRWLGGARCFPDGAAEPSPLPFSGLTTFV